jgi:arylsulfatase A-like enzyme
MVETMRTISRRSLLAGSLAASIEAATPSPNILYILADDLGWGDLSCYNPSSAIPTPNLDRFATQGVRFTDMHSPSSVCTPTRYGILTGRYCWRTQLKKGVLWGYSPNLIEPGRLTVPALLQKYGYTTAGIGKWHLGLGTAEKVDYSGRFSPGPLDHGFDSYFGIPASLDMEPYVYIDNDHAFERPTGTTPGQNSPRGVFWRPGPIAPGFKIEEVLPTLEQRAVHFIATRREARKPFFLYLPLTAPHTPWVPGKAFRGRSKAGDYGDFVAQTDAVIGAVLGALDENKLSSNTLVFITSDNGAHWTPDDQQRFPHRANASWRGMKADIWEAGHRIPFLARWPGHIKPGSVSNQLGCLTDLAATVADVIGAKLLRNAAEDSFSLVPALTGVKKGPVRETVVHHSSEGMFAIRQGPWKLALGLGSGGFSEPKTLPADASGVTGQLFNLASDPGETTNLFKQEPKVIADLSALLNRYQLQGFSRPMRT